VQQALDKMIHFVPSDKREQLLLDLSMNLRAIVAQKLVKRINSKERYPAFELLSNNPEIKPYLRKGDSEAIAELMNNANSDTLHTFNQSLCELYINNVISYDDAIDAADNKNELRLMIKHRQH
jgi:twitching motility protein PilU